MAIYTGDQQTVTAAVINGVTVAANATVVDAIPGVATDYEVSADVTLVYNGQTIHFRPAVPYPMDAGLYAAAVAAGITLTAV